MKLINSLLPIVCCEWIQPTYYEALRLAKSRSNEWAHPVDPKAGNGANWDLCPALGPEQGLETSEGEGVMCAEATCMLTCPAGELPIGRRRTKCRWKRKRGFFWRRPLGNCEGCDPTDPTSLFTDDNLTVACGINAKNKMVCTLTCPEGTTNSLTNKKEQKIKCRCPKHTSCWMPPDISHLKSVSCETKNVCGWHVGNAILNASGMSAMKCVDPSATTTTPAPTTTPEPNPTRADCLLAIPNESHKEAICDELVRVNIYRMQHNANPLQIDPSLCTTAAAKAAELALQNDSSCRIEHNKADLQAVGQGENLYCGVGIGCMAKTPAQHMEIASKMWQHEVNDWNQADCNDNTCNEANNCVENAQFGCGHFTQQIWKSTTHMCYQYAKGPDDREYIVARYSPPGNTEGMYQNELEGSDCIGITEAESQLGPDAELAAMVNDPNNFVTPQQVCMSTEYDSIGNTCST